MAGPHTSGLRHIGRLRCFYMRQISSVPHPFAFFLAKAWKTSELDSIIRETAKN